VSRGALIGGAVGALALVALCRSRGALVGVPVALAGATVAVVACAGATRLTGVPVSAAGVASGHRTALWLGACVLATVALRAALLCVDRRVATVRLPRPGRRSVLAGAVAGALAAVGVLVLAGGAQRVADTYESFTSSSSVPLDAPAEQRFTTIANNGPIDHWAVALSEGFGPHPLQGSGAGTYQLLWAHGRDNDFVVLDAHSVYVEVLGELGIVGLALLVAGLVTMLAALGVRALRDGAAWAGLAAAAAAWAVHAGIDWMWETPAVTLWLFAAGGLALSRPRRDGVAAAASGSARRRTAKVLLGLACVALAVLPVQILRSQRALQDAFAAFRTGDCAAATSAALAAHRALGARAEPFEVMAYCAIRRDRPEVALRAIQAAERRDPGNWEYRYDEAIVRGVLGRRPIAAAREALRLNPLSPTTQAAVRWFDGPRRTWRSRALAAPTLVPPP